MDIIDIIDQVLAECEIAQEDDDPTAGFLIPVDYDRSFT